MTTDPLHRISNRVFGQRGESVTLEAINGTASSGRIIAEASCYDASLDYILDIAQSRNRHKTLLTGLPAVHFSHCVRTIEPAKAFHDKKMYTTHTTMPALFCSCPRQASHIPICGRTPYHSHTAYPMRRA